MDVIDVSQTNGGRKPARYSFVVGDNDKRRTDVLAHALH
jgi:hypothetical protein